MSDAWKLNNREQIFKSGRNISNRLGDIAQNDMILSTIDINNELLRCDDIIKELEEYKRLVIQKVEPFK